MKRLRRVLAGAAVAALAAAGSLGWILRPRPQPRPEEAAGAAFSLQPVQAGWILQHLDEQIPLRAIRWVPTRGSEHLVAQVLTQSDQQWVFLFGPGRPLGRWRVERGADVEEGFFRFAELKEAWLAPDGILLLRYGPGAGTSAEGLLVALGPEGTVWSLRLDGTRMVPLPEANALLVWGSPSGILRIPLAASAGAAPRPVRIELPAEIAGPFDLLPLGRDRFAVAHGRGLSVFVGAEGWVHHPAPERPSWPAWPNNRGRLAGVGGRRWWQPAPGTLWELGADGRPLREVPLELAPSEGSARDRAMLTLLGCGPQGELWFGLSGPTLAPPAPVAGPAGEAAPQPPATPEAAPPEPATTVAAPAPPPPEEIEAWQRHLGGGLDRIYQMPAHGGPLRRFDWARLWSGLPEASGFPRPAGDAGLRPDCGFLVVGAERRVWWLPLAALEGAARPGNRTGSGG